MLVEFWCVVSVSMSYSTYFPSVPPEILTPPRDKSVSIAERVILPCQVGGDPRPEVIWMKNGRPVQLSDRIQQLENDSLVIYRSTVSNKLKA